MSTVILLLNFEKLMIKTTKLLLSSWEYFVVIRPFPKLLVIITPNHAYCVKIIIIIFIMYFLSQSPYYKMRNSNFM